MHDDPKAVAAEAFRTLRTNLQFTNPDRNLKSLLVTSPGPGEGKSTVAANLAVAWAQAGRKVAVVECDFRRPVLDHFFPLKAEQGLTAYLAGQVPLEAVIRASGIPGLDILLAGAQPPNPAELLQTQAMAAALDYLEENYDWVVFDGPPILAVTDSAVLANQVDGTILVIQAYEVPRKMALQAKNLLDQAKGHLLGVVLNGIRPRGGQDYQYYYYARDLEQTL